MKILHLSAVNNWGGGEKHIENLCLELAESNPEVSNLILCRKNSAFEASLKNSNLDFKTAPIFTNLDPRYFLEIIKICRDENIDLIHIHDPTALALAVIADKFSKLPDFIFSKKTSFPIRQKKRSLYKYNYPKIQKVLCVSDFSKKMLANSFAEKHKLKKVYHGIRVKRQDALKSVFSIREKFGLAGDIKVIGNIANHTWPKDLDCLIDTANELINIGKRKDFAFVQIGSFTRETAKLQEKIKKSGLENYFHFTGFQQAAPAYLKQFDYFLLTSKSEGLPNVIGEAFYHNTPVISTNVGGIPEIVSHKRTGLLANKGDAKGLAAQVLFLEKNPELKEQLLKNARQLILDKFTTHKMAQESLEEYKNIVYGRS